MVLLKKETWSESRQIRVFVAEAAPGSGSHKGGQFICWSPQAASGLVSKTGVLPPTGCSTFPFVLILKLLPESFKGSSDILEWSKCIVLGGREKQEGCGFSFFIDDIIQGSFRMCFISTKG